MQLGRVEVTPGFLLLAAWLNLIDRQMLLPLAVAGCLIHELGHLAALHLFGNSIRKVRITAVGAEIRVSRTMSYYEELVAALAGPAANLLLAAALCALPAGETAAGLNLALAAFNLLPCSHLDGGRALRCVLVLALDMERGEWLAAMVSALCVITVGALGIFVAVTAGNITLAVVSLWLLSAERKKSRYKKSKQFMA